MSTLKRIDKNEFFWDNPQMLGFVNPTRSTLMVVKEIIDNALDACEDIGILPEISVKLTSDGDIFTIEAQDNGSGIPNPRQNVPHVFGEILFGSKFGVYKQSRGQQGIGISAAFLWSQKTVGEPVIVKTKPVNDSYIHEFTLTTKGKGKLVVLSYNKYEYNDIDHGTYIKMSFKGSWRSKQHLLMYLEGTALANPEANINISINDYHMSFKRVTDKPSPKPRTVKPHPHTADIGYLQEIISRSSSRKIKNLLFDTFSSFGDSALNELQGKISFSLDKNPRYLKKHEIRELVDAIKTIKFRAPPSSCIAPLGTDRILSAFKRYNPEYCHAVTRDMNIHDGHPFLIEVGVAYGGDIKGFSFYRLANKVPLIYDEGNCALTEGLKHVDFRNYGFRYVNNGYPDAPLLVLVHMCSTHIPYGNQAKTYVSGKDIIVSEVKLAIQQVMRKVNTYVNKKNYHKQLKTEIDQRFNIATLLANKVYDVLDVGDEPPYESIARMCKCLLYDDITGELINTTDDVVKINGNTLQPNDRIKTNSKPDIINVVTKTDIDKQFA